MNPRRSPLITTAVVAAAIGLAACTPAPVPEPTPTPLFASEAEAFKAAEQVYRDYIAAVNAEESTPASNPQRFLVGQALEEDISSVRDLESAGKRIVGATVVSGFDGRSFASQSMMVTSLACLDVSATRIMDASGNDVTSKDRALIVAVNVSMTLVSKEFKIARMDASSESCS